MPSAPRRARNNIIPLAARQPIEFFSLCDGSQHYHDDFGALELYLNGYNQRSKNGSC
ncbi:hypothetical protein EMIT0111MI5_20609 [Burkholderia sp. IT-111MI5]